MIERVLVVAAHPDDEALGCGGTIAKHAARGDQVTVLCLADGVSSRAFDPAAMEARQKQFRSACRVLGTGDVWLKDFPDNRMDALPMLKVAQAVQEQFDRVRPTVVYTHSAVDLNIDHRVTNEAVQICCRPQPGATVRRLLYFEVPSATEWGIGVFRPQHFEDITATLGKKLDALACYAAEMREFPHPRSVEGVRAMAWMRGVTAGVAAAEGFMVGRTIS